MQPLYTIKGIILHGKNRGNRDLSFDYSRQSLTGKNKAAVLILDELHVIAFRTLFDFRKRLRRTRVGGSRT